MSIQKVTQDTESEYWILDAESGRIRAYDRSESVGRLRCRECAGGYPGSATAVAMWQWLPHDPSTLNSQLLKFLTLTDALGLAYDASPRAFISLKKQVASTYFSTNSVALAPQSTFCISNPLSENASVEFFAGSANGTGYSNGAPPIRSSIDPREWPLLIGYQPAEGYLYIADSGNHVIRRIRRLWLLHRKRR